MLNYLYSDSEQRSLALSPDAFFDVGSALEAFPEDDRSTESFGMEKTLKIIEHNC